MVAVGLELGFGFLIGIPVTATGVLVFPKTLNLTLFPTKTTSCSRFEAAGETTS